MALLEIAGDGVVEARQGESNWIGVRRRGYSIASGAKRGRQSRMTRDVGDEVIRGAWGWSWGMRLLVGPVMILRLFGVLASNVVMPGEWTSTALMPLVGKRGRGTNERMRDTPSSFEVEAKVHVGHLHA